METLSRECSYRGRVYPPKQQLWRERATAHDGPAEHTVYIITLYAKSGVVPAHTQGSVERELPG